VSLSDHYQHTTYRVTSVTPAIDIRIGEPCLALDALLDKHAARSWAFITAWNPGSKKLDAGENQKRQAALEAEVKQGGCIFYRGAGVPDEKNWDPEESILIVGINSADAVKLGKKYAQAAIVAGGRDAPAELIFIN
jgi:hypothetical protein